MRKKSNIPFEERHKQAMAKYRAKYAFVMLPKDIHADLKVYCEEQGFIMSRFVTNLIKKELKGRK